MLRKYLLTRLIYTFIYITTMKLTKPKTQNGPCLTQGCRRVARVRGMCLTCYHRFRRETKMAGECSVEGCTKGVQASGLCAGHYLKRYKELYG